MKPLEKILVPTDLSEESRRGLRYACSLAAEEQAAILVLHVANEFKAWDMYSDDLGAFAIRIGRGRWIVFLPKPL